MTINVLDVYKRYKIVSQLLQELIRLHKDMKEMGIEIQRMIIYSATNQHEEFKASLCLVILYSETFDHFMGISLQNIF